MHHLRRPRLSAAQPALSLRWLAAIAAATILAAPPASAQSAPAPTPAQPTTEPKPAPTPGLTPDQDDDGLQSFHGLPSTQTTVLRDGLDQTQNLTATPAGTGTDPAPDPAGDPDSAGQTTGPANGLACGRHAAAASTFSRAAARELRLNLNFAAYSTQTSHIAAGAVELATQSGTAQWHANAAFTYRSAALAAYDPLAIATTYAGGTITTGPVKPHDNRETLSITAGGPVPRVRKLSLLYSFEGENRNFPAVSSPSDPNFYRLTATQTALLANRGVTATAIDAGLNYLSSLTGQTPRSADNTINFLRLDWKPRPHLTLAADYNRVRWNRPAGLSEAPVVARGRASLGSSSGSLDQLQLSLAFAPLPHLIDELTVQLTRDLQYESPERSLPQEPAIGPDLGLGLGPLAPQVLIGPNGLLFGTPVGTTQSALPDERRLSIAETVTYTRGSHVVTAGGSASFFTDRVASLQNAEGSFVYDSGTTGGHAGGLVDFLADYTFNVNAPTFGPCPAITAANHTFCFRSFSQSFGQQSVGFPTALFAAFAQDQWKVSPRLTILAGLRYDYTLLPIPQAPNAALDQIFGSRGATSVFPEDRNNFGPRAAVSYQPFGAGRGTIHLGAGLFYGRLPGATIRSALSDTAQSTANTRIRFTPDATIACPQVPQRGFGYPCSFLNQPSSIVAQTTSAVVFDRRFRLPAIFSGSLALERELPRRTTVRLGYAVSLARQLATSTDLNIAPSSGTQLFQLQGGTGQSGVTSGETFRLPVYTARISPSFGPVTDITSSANASYHALNATIDSQPFKGLLLRAVTTWSKAIDFAPALSATPRTLGQFDPFANGYDKGLSTLDFPWQTTVTGRYEPRPTPSLPWLRELVQGWDLAPVLVVRSGRPYSLDLGGGTRLPGGHESLNGAGGSLYLPTVGRNTLRLAKTIRTDLELARELKVGHRIRGRASVQAFNLFNHRQISSVAERAYLVGTAAGGVTPLVFQSASAIAQEGLNTQPFGTPTGAGSSLSRERQVQFRIVAEF